MQREDFIYDSARGFWDINIRRTRYAKYVLALYRQIVVGVYPVNEDSWRVTTDFDEKEFPIYPKKYRENDKLLIQKNRTYDEYKRLGGQNDKNGLIHVGRESVLKSASLRTARNIRIYAN